MVLVEILQLLNGGEPVATRRTPSSGEGGSGTLSSFALRLAQCQALTTMAAVCQHSSRRKWKAKVWQEQMDGNSGDFVECSESFQKTFETFQNFSKLLATWRRIP